MKSESLQAGGVCQTEREGTIAPVSPERQHQHVRNVTCSMLSDALKIWSELYGEFEGVVSHGAMVTGNVPNGVVPVRGWPEFLEKMWLLHHYLDHAKRICEGRA
jgi:hypothetical protein